MRTVRLNCDTCDGYVLQINMVWLHLLYVVFFISLVRGDLPWEYKGTSPGLQSIIIGRCYQYKVFNRLNRRDEFSVSANCTKLWEAFKGSFGWKDICRVNESDYDALFKLTTNPKKSKQILFWSGTRKIAHDFSYVNDDYVTLEDSFPGYLANGLRWCGCNCSTGIDFKTCDTSCPNNGLNAYWSRASRNLAEKATGTAYVLVNGTGRGINTAYYRGSYFGRVELPRLGKLRQITKLIVLVALDLNMKAKEKCGEGTLNELISDAKKYGIREVECEDNPVMVLGVLCAKYPHADLCKDFLMNRNWKVIGIVFIVVFGVFLIAVASFHIVRRVKKGPQTL